METSVTAMLKLLNLGMTLLSVAGLALGSESQSKAPWVSYKNPVIPGFNPDPSCIRVDSDFFCATSTFNFFPGIPIYNSKDLVHWTHLGHVISRPGQFPELATLNGSSGGIWAPGLFYAPTLSCTTG